MNIEQNNKTLQQILDGLNNLTDKETFVSKVISGDYFKENPVFNYNYPYIKPGAFYFQQNLREVNFKQDIDILPFNCFSDCWDFTKITFQNVNTIQKDSLTGTPFLESLVIRGRTIPVLENSEEFVNSSIQAIFVPDDLIEAYCEDTNWGLYSYLFMGLSELEEEQ